MTLADVVFLVCAVVCAVSALASVSRKNPVYSVVYMLPFCLGLTALFAMLQATFLAAIQMIVYGGAILVLFLVVLMLMNLKPEELKDDFAAFPYALTALAAAMLGGVLAVFVRHGVSAGLEEAFAKPASAPGFDPDFGSIRNLAGPLFRQQLVPFELVSVLLGAAIVGAVLLARKKV